MITKAELDLRFAQAFGLLPAGDIGGVANMLQEQLAYCNQHYNEFDQEAKAVVDSVFSALKKEMGTVIRSLPDSNQKRQLLRLHARASGRHHDVKDVMGVLEHEPQPHLVVPFTRDARAIFDSGMQNISDFLFDISQTRLGPPHGVCFMLMFHCFDELLAGMHLAQRAYCMQAYAHARATLECLDKIELFFQQPQWIDVWAGNDEEIIRREFKPSAVRAKLGNPPHDPLYGFLSQLGSHASFRSLQGRVAWRSASRDQEVPQARIWYGGSPQVHHMLWAHFHVLNGVLQVLLKTVKIFSGCLDQGEVLQAADSFVQCFSQYLVDHFLPWAKQQGIPVGEFEKELREGLAGFGIVLTQAQEIIK